jgi:hypothetical protein
LEVIFAFKPPGLGLNFLLLCEGGSSSGGGGSHSNAGPGEGKDVVELTEANFRKKVINSEKVSLSSMPNPVCCGSGMLIPDPTRTKREDEKFIGSHKFHKIENYFIFVKVETNFLSIDNEVKYL